MLELKIKLPRRAELAALRVLDGKAVAWAEAQACTRTARNVADDGRKAIAEKMGVPVSKLARRGRKVDFRGSAQFGGMNLVRKASRHRLEALVSGRGRPFNVMRFGATPIRMGSASSIKTRRAIGGRKAKRGRVIGVTHTAYNRRQTAVGVWMLGNGAFMISDGAGSFRGVFGPGVTWVLERPDVRTRLERLAAERFGEHLATALRYAFGSQFHAR